MSRPTEARAPSAWRRHRGLVRAFRRRLGRGWVYRVGRVSAWYAAVAHGGWAVLADRAGGLDGSMFLSRALGWITVGAAVVAVSSAVDLGEVERADGLEALLRVRGVTFRERRRARYVAATEVVTRTILLPGLVVAAALLGISDSFADVVARTLRLGAVTLYALLAGVLLATLARWATFAAPRRARTLLLAMLLLPDVFLLATGDGPSVIRLFGDMLGRIEGIAGGIG